MFCRSMIRIGRIAPLLVVAALASSTSRVNASPTIRVAGVDLDSEIRADRCTLHLNGAGLHEVGMFDVDVYVAALYVEHASSNAREILESEQTIQLLLEFKRDIARSDLIEAAETSIRAHAANLGARFGARLAKLERGLRDVHAGDRLRITYDKGVGIELTLNDEHCGAVAGDDFARALLGTWLGPQPVSRDLKHRLLGTH